MWVLLEGMSAPHCATFMILNLSTVPIGCLSITGEASLGVFTIPVLAKMCSNTTSRDRKP